MVNLVSLDVMSKTKYQQCKISCLRACICLVKIGFVYCLVEELEREHYQRIQLGFKPEAPPPDLVNVKPRISTRHDRKYVKKPTKGR